MSFLVCRQDNKCRGFNFKRTGTTTCWLLNLENMSGPVSDYNGIDCYQRKDCIITRMPTWKPTQQPVPTSIPTTRSPTIVNYTYAPTDFSTEHPTIPLTDEPSETPTSMRPTFPSRSPTSSPTTNLPTTNSPTSEMVASQVIQHLFCLASNCC
jgi:hypothetical protein